MTIRNQLVILNFGLVRKKHYWSNQCTENYDDLLQIGCIGLIQAIERFDMSKEMPSVRLRSPIFVVKFNTTCECHGARSPTLAGATAAVSVRGTAKAQPSTD